MFERATSFDQDIGAWSLRPEGVDLSDFLTGPSLQFSQENYSRTLVGWSNTVGVNGGPVSVSTAFFDRTYNDVNYQPSSRFPNAVAARAFLTAPRSLSVAGAADTDANGTYLFNAATGIYANSLDWYFLKTGSTWVLYNDLDAEQASGDGENPWDVATWTGTLSAATLLNEGAAWTISGDSAA